jgi:hypothetical protein
MRYRIAVGRDAHPTKMAGRNVTVVASLPTFQGMFAAADNGGDTSSGNTVIFLG